MLFLKENTGGICGVWGRKFGASLFGYAFV
jgi:hypothetical protein